MAQFYNKLVRDKIPEILDKKGISYEMRTVSDEEYKSELVKKLEEEFEEFKSDMSVDELADVLEVLCAIKNLPEYANVEDVRKKKKEERGGFEKRLVLKGKKS